MRRFLLYPQLFLTFARNSLIRDMTFRANFLIEVVSSIGWMAMNLGFYVLVYSYTSSIEGWNQYQFFVFIATTMFINSVVQGLFMPNAEEMSEMVRTGGLDFALLKPIDTQFLLSLRKINWSSLGNFLVAIGFSGLMGALRRFLSPVVVGPVIMLIGLALYNAGAPVAASHWPTSIMTIVMIIVFSLVLARNHWLFRLFPLLLAILLSVAVCGLLTALGYYGSGHPAHVGFEEVQNSEWIRTTDVFFPWGVPEFSAAFIVAVLAGYLASMIESFGDYHACSHMAGAGDPSPEQISRGIGCEGIGCALTGVFGGFSSTSYSENVGLVGLTKVGSRYVVQIAAVILVVLGLFGKFGAVAAAIPKPVVGGLYCALFGLISAVGVRQLAKADLDSNRNLFISGFALFMGLSLPAYFNSPAGAQLIESVPGGLGAILGAIGKTGMAVAAILGIALDNLIPGTATERGLAEEEGPGVLVPEAGDVDV